MGYYVTIKKKKDLLCNNKKDLYWRSNIVEPGRHPVYKRSFTLKKNQSLVCKVIYMKSETGKTPLWWEMSKVGEGVGKKWRWRSILWIGRLTHIMGVILTWHWQPNPLSLLCFVFFCVNYTSVFCFVLRSPLPLLRQLQSDKWKGIWDCST